MNRRNEILIAALVVQVILIVLLTTLRAPAASVSGKPLFAGLKAPDITQLAVQNKDGKRVDLVKQNNNWVLSKIGDFPADNTKVGAFLDKLVKVDTGRLIAQTASSYGRLQVADDNYVARVDFTSANGAVHTLLVGSSPAGGAVHVRGDGGADVYLTDSLNSTDASPDAVSWINPVFVSAQQDQVTSVAVTNHNGTFQFEKDSSNNWQMKGLAKGETFDATKLTDQLQRMTALTIIGPLGKTLKPEYGLQPPAATITLTLKQQAASAKPLVVRIGAKNATDNSYTVAYSESPYYVQVSSSNVEDFVTGARQDYLKLPPTAVPTTTVTAAP